MMSLTEREYLSVYVNLNNEINKHNVPISVLAELIGVSEDIFMDKLNGLLPWYLSEVLNICCFFKISDVKFLFLQLDTNR